MINLILKFLARTSLTFHHRLGKAIGVLLYYFNNRNRHIAKVNISICFPELNDQQKKSLLKTTLIENGKTLIECFWLWRNPQQVLTTLTGKIENRHFLNDAGRQSSGTIFVTPHFGSWEFIGLLTAASTDLLILYAPPKSASIEQLSCQGRTSTGGKVISTESLNIKTLIRHIKAGGSVGILPDQVPEGNGGVYSHFFGRQCYTSTLVCKLAHKLNCPVVFCYALRNDEKPFCYDAYYFAANEKIYDSDIVIACDTLNHTIESLINSRPGQYLWSYKRFKRPAPGNDYPY